MIIDDLMTLTRKELRHSINGPTYYLTLLSMKEKFQIDGKFPSPLPKELKVFIANETSFNFDPYGKIDKEIISFVQDLEQNLLDEKNSITELAKSKVNFTQRIIDLIMAK